ncbi:hypothetical protein GCM10023114_58230 [Mycolicibacterium sediminis]|uniref:Uncharacterized protein n=1 Tax=Mycolicibacterium sediminis TaxID=1286180 RepID=A0A7I7QP94_9MYCO|nr:hypothetical protein MSEDJ_22370 [Mycolicibacterium sediminis]
MRGPILLGGYAAKQCPVRVQNDFLPRSPTITWEPSLKDRARLEAGSAFEVSVFKRLVAVTPATVVVDSGLGKDEAISKTVQAMKSGAPLILGGWLPADVEGGRTGKPDILVNVDSGYLPADVKNHLTVKRARVKGSVVSSLSSPGRWLTLAGWTPGTTTRTPYSWLLTHACSKRVVITPDPDTYGPRCSAPTGSR